MLMYNSVSNTSFKGSYLITYKNSSKVARECFESAIGEHKRQIFDAFDGKKGQVFYVMKHSKDYDAAQVVRQHHLNFKYFPKMDTKLRFDTEKPEEVINYINENNPEPITKLADLMKYVENYRIRCRAKYKDVAPQKSLVETILENLKIEMNGEKTKDSRGIITIKDEQNKGLVVISPKSKFGISYVFHKPANKYENEKRYAVSETGEVLATFNSPDGIKRFKECFVKATKKK